MQFLTTVLYFLVTLGVLVLVHELGHFLAAKFFRMRVDRFSIGFPPRAFGRQFGETDYCVSWIPIGGYVKIAGMVDESFDTEFLNHAPEPWEFRAKPIWQRMVVISAGVIMNLLLAACIFTGITYQQGEDVRETTTLGHVTPGSPAATAGLISGDRLLLINDKPVSTWDEIYTDVYLESIGRDVTVKAQRGDSIINAFFSHTVLQDPAQTSLGIFPEHTEVAIGTVDPGKPADKLGLKPNDLLVSLNGVPVNLDQYDQRVREIVKSSAGKELHVVWLRNGQEMSGTTIPTQDGRIGISFGAKYFGPIKHIQYSIPGAAVRGVARIGDVVVLFVKQIWQIAAGKMAFSQSVGGPIKIAQMATQTAEIGLLAYLGFVGLLSVSLAVLNILPFPALDGGHLFYLIYEAIFRREIPAAVKIALQRAGFVLLLAFMAFVMYNDIVHF